MKRRYSPQDVVNYLKRKGYAIGNSEGIAGEPQFNDLFKVVGILKAVPGRKERAYLANLWLHKKEKGAEEGKKWIIEYFGIENKREILRLSGHLSNYYRVAIERVMLSETPHSERIYNDPMIA